MKIDKTRQLTRQDNLQDMTMTRQFTRHDKDNILKKLQEKLKYHKILEVFSSHKQVYMSFQHSENVLIDIIKKYLWED